MNGFKQVGAVWAVVATLAITAGAQEMTAHFIDVGQGDATLLEFPCGAILIDAGGQSNWHVSRLIGYLRDFFERRSDLEGTLESVIITHTHKDHNVALRRVLEEFNVRRYVDNGRVSGSGKHMARWVREQIESDALETKLVEVTDDNVTNLESEDGLTNNDIDPINCGEQDPLIRVLSSSLSENPGWPAKAFDDENNHSIVVRVDFGKSSFLFTGDQEDEGNETLVDYYQGSDLLDVDVYQVGHHGSANGTSQLLLDAMSPAMAVISCGKHSSRGTWTAYSYGHPRKTIVSMLDEGVSGTRTPTQVHVATGKRKFELQTVDSAVYATAWDGTVTITGHWNGEPTIP